MSTPPLGAPAETLLTSCPPRRRSSVRRVSVCPTPQVMGWTCPPRPLRLRRMFRVRSTVSAGRCPRRVNAWGAQLVTASRGGCARSTSVASVVTSAATSAVGSTTGSSAGYRTCPVGSAVCSTTRSGRCPLVSLARRRSSVPPPLARSSSGSAGRWSAVSCSRSSRRRSASARASRRDLARPLGASTRRTGASRSLRSATPSRWCSRTSPASVTCRRRSWSRWRLPLWRRRRCSTRTCDSRSTLQRS